MDTNPYKDHTPSLKPPATRGPGWKSRILWFVLGFGASWAVWSVVNYMALAPRDETRNWPNEIREGAPEWMKNAKGRRVGNFTIVAADGPRESAQVTPTQSNRNPGISFDDVDSDGRVDSLLVTDAKHRVFEFVVVEGQFKSFSYSPDLMAIDSTEFFDYDMDGRMDLRIGPVRRYTLNVDDRWCELILEGGAKGYVNVNGTRVLAEHVNGAWRIVK